ncbi:MAG: hypothetical protein OXN17_14945 [Candidatus Poribacteria bacterium]|nr:hypothetical protein [Candidatus Poribacteria bacterium]
MNSRQESSPFLVTNDDDHRQALAYAKQSVDYTYNRMEIAKKQSRQNNIYLGKLIEGPICRELEDTYRITVNRSSVTTHHTQADKGDVLLSFECSQSHTGDIKGFRVRGVIGGRQSRANEMASRAYALVPVDQLDQRPKDIYIFTNVMLQSGQDRETGIEITTALALLTYPRWAPVGEVSKWQEYPKGSRVYPYTQRGTQVPNKGSKFSGLHALWKLPPYLETDTTAT